MITTWLLILCGLFLFLAAAIAWQIWRERRHSVALVNEDTEIAEAQRAIRALRNKAEVKAKQRRAEQ